MIPTTLHNVHFSIVLTDLNGYSLSNGMEWQIFALVSNSHLFPRSHMSTLTQHFFGSRKGIDPVWQVQKHRAWGQSNPRWDRRPLRSRPSEVFHCYQRGDHVLLIYVYSRSEAGAGRSMPLLCDNKCYTYHTLNTITSQLRTFFFSVAREGLAQCQN